MIGATLTIYDYRATWNESHFTIISSCKVKEGKVQDLSLQKRVLYA